MADTLVGGILAKLKLDTTQFRAGIKSAKGLTKDMGLGMKDLGGAFRATATAAVGFGAAIAGVVKVAGDFEQTMANVGAVTGATGAKLAELSTIATDMGQATIFSASQAGDAMFALGSQGIKTAANFRNVLKPALDLAAATQSEIASTTEALVGNIRAFGLEMSDAGRVANIFSAANENSALTAERLTNALRPVAPLAGSLGVSIENVTAVLGVLVNRNFEAAEAGTALRNIFLRLQKPVGDAKKILDKAGFSAKKLGELTEDPVKLMQELREANLSTADAITIFGARAVGAFKALEAAGDDLENLRDNITGTDSATRIAARQLDTFNSQVKLLKSAAEGLAIEIGTGLLPAFRSLVERFTAATKSTIKFVKENSAMVATMVRFTGESLLAATAILGVAFGIAKVVIIIKKVRVAMMAANLASPWIAVAAALAIVVERASSYFLKLAEERSAVASVANANMGLAQRHLEVADAIDKLSEKEKTRANINRILAKEGLPLRVKSEEDLKRVTDRLRGSAAALIKQDEDRTKAEQVAAQERIKAAQGETKAKVTAEKEKNDAIAIERALSEETLLDEARGFTQEELILFQQRKQAMLDLVAAGKLSWSDYYIWLDDQGRQFNDIDAERWLSWVNFIDGVFASAQQSWSTAMQGLITGTKTGTEAMKAMWKGFKDSVIKAVADMLAKFIAAMLKMIAMKIAGGILSGGTSFLGGLFSQGGVVGAANGLLPPGEDMLIGVQRGEAVISRAGVAAMGGPPAVDAINQAGRGGGPVGGGGDHFEFHVTSLTGHINEEDRAEIIRMIQDEKRRAVGGI